MIELMCVGMFVLCVYKCGCLSERVSVCVFACVCCCVFVCVWCVRLL